MQFLFQDLPIPVFLDNRIAVYYDRKENDDKSIDYSKKRDAFGDKFKNFFHIKNVQICDFRMND